MNKLLAISIILTLASKVDGQQLARFSNLGINNYYFNPAIGPDVHQTLLTTTYRKQWSGFQNAPVTATFAGYTAIKKKHRVGGFLISDRLGMQSFTVTNLSYSFKARLAETVHLSLGLAGTLSRRTYTGIDLQVRDPLDQTLSYPSFQHTLIPDVDFGIYLRGPVFFFGVSMMQMAGSSLNWSSIPEDQNLGFANSNHAYIMGGYAFVAGDRLKIEPSAIMLIGKFPNQTQLNARFIYKEQYWLGGAYRSDESVAASFGIRFSYNIRMAYAFDFTTSPLKYHHSGSHEISLRFIPGETDSNEE